jgi:ligand-binding SRPBCC domain-containing protein
VPVEFIKESHIDASPERVFAFHESPGALERLTPPWEHIVVESGGASIRPGERVTLRTKLGPFPLRWVAEHTEYDPPRMFADRQVSGPFAIWSHRHRMIDDGRGGTTLRDEVTYELPGGALGRWLGRRMVRRKLERLFRFRHEVTKRVVESAEIANNHAGAGV